jgi:SpoVK/Ycf46/Vps4 family AAA+-type ATPase
LLHGFRALHVAATLLLQDEVDSLGQSRDSNSDAGARRLLTELLIQFNKVAEEEGVYIFAATNRMQVMLCWLTTVTAAILQAL